MRREWRMTITESDCSFGPFGGLGLPPTADDGNHAPADARTGVNWPAHACAACASKFRYGREVPDQA
jgi:hypothetical protein